MSNKHAVGWSRLDNAAKIFPPTSSRRDPRVFRFSCELNEPVDPVVLQKALDVTLEQFPHYRSVLRKGFFWYYLEASSLRPMIHEERGTPCGRLFDRHVTRLLIRVTYYHCRINLEVYHALSDGTGALHFLQRLVLRYLKLCHPCDFSGPVTIPGEDASMGERLDDSFEKYYEKAEKTGGKAAQPAYRIHGAKLQKGYLSVIEGVASVSQAIALAHKYQTTLTVFLTAVLLCAIGEGIPLRERKKPVVLSVPVNLRQYFDSSTARNFFGMISVAHQFAGQLPPLAQVAQSIGDIFKRELTKEQLSIRMNQLAGLEHNAFARAAPLFFKDVCLRVAGWQSQSYETATLSNVGRIDMPPEAARHIRLFDVFSSTTSMQLCICSFSDNLVLSFSSAFVRADIQHRFFRTLAQMGLAVEISANDTEQAVLG